MIVQNVSEGGVATDLTFTLSKGDFERALKVLDDGRGRLGIRAVVSDPNVVKVSLIAVAMRTHAGAAPRTFQPLAHKRIHLPPLPPSATTPTTLSTTNPTPPDH